MIPVGSLIWSLLAALLVTALSLFYNNNGSSGYPLSVTYYAQPSIAHGEGELSDQTATSAAVVAQKIKQMSWTTFGADVLFWWVIFSILLVVVKNYVLDDYQEKSKSHSERNSEDHSKHEKEVNR